MKIVVVNGCFDVIHIGHIWHLQAAREMGDRLIVSLTTDEHVNKGPGRPVMTWHERAAILSALRCVDLVVPTRSSVDAILSLRPDIFVKGIDYADDENWGEDVRAACKEAATELRFTYTPKRGSGEYVDRIKAL